MLINSLFIHFTTNNISVSFIKQNPEIKATLNVIQCLKSITDYARGSILPSMTINWIENLFVKKTPESLTTLLNNHEIFEE